MHRKWVMFAGLVCGAHGGHETAQVRDVRAAGEWGVFWKISELLVSTPTSGRLQPRRTRRYECFIAECHIILLWRYSIFSSLFCFVLFRFVFVFFALFESSALRLVVLHVMCPDSHTQLGNNRLCPLLFLVFFLEMLLLPSILYTVSCTIVVSSWYGEYVERFGSGCCMPTFFLVTTGWNFYISLLCEISINPINQRGYADNDSQWDIIGFPKIVVDV